MQLDSKKPKPAERRQLRQLEKASKAATGSSRLLESVAEIGGTVDMQLFRVGFKHYRPDICKIKDTNASTAKKVFEGLKNICSCSSEAEIYKLPMDMKRTESVGYYAKYAKGLTPDTDISEFDAGGIEDFFMLIDQITRLKSLR